MLSCRVSLAPVVPFAIELQFVQRKGLADRAALELEQHIRARRDGCRYGRIRSYARPRHAQWKRRGYRLRPACASGGAQAVFVDLPMVGHRASDVASVARYYKGALIVLGRYALQRPELLFEFVRMLAVGAYLVLRSYLSLRNISFRSGTAYASCTRSVRSGRKGEDVPPVVVPQSEGFADIRIGSRWVRRWARLVGLHPLRPRPVRAARRLRWRATRRAGSPSSRQAHARGNVHCRSDSAARAGVARSAGETPTRSGSRHSVRARFTSPVMKSNNAPGPRAHGAQVGTLRARVPHSSCLGLPIATRTTSGRASMIASRMSGSWLAVKYLSAWPTTLCNAANADGSWRRRSAGSQQKKCAAARARLSK